MAPPSEVVAVAPPIGAQPESAAASYPDPARLQPNVGALLYEVSRLMRRRFERRARQTGLAITRQQARALLYIARNEGLSQAAVATMLDIEPIALVRMIDRLHEEGLVDRRLHPTDRRVRTLWLAPPAWAVIDRVLAINAEVRDEACANMPAATRDMLRRALLAMKANLGAAEAREAAAAE